MKTIIVSAAIMLALLPAARPLAALVRPGEAETPASLKQSASVPAEGTSAQTEPASAATDDTDDPTGESPEREMQDLVIIPSGFEELTELRINTQEKAVLADGSINDVYKLETPADGNVFAHLVLQIATGDGDSLRLGHDDLELVDESGKEPVAYHPFDWFVDSGLAPDHQGLVTVAGKAALEFTIEVPKKNMDALVLYVGPNRVGTLGEVRARSEKSNEGS